jgi:nitrate reductase NapAB chaperone NapD
LIITGSALFIEPDSSKRVKSLASEFPEVTVYAESQSGSEIIITIEADGEMDLDRICNELRARIPEIVDIAHLYVNFEDEIEKFTGNSDQGKGVEAPTYWE